MSIRKALKNNEKIELREFGTFFLKELKKNTQQEIRRQEN